MAITWTKTAGQIATAAAQRITMIGEGQSLDGHKWVVAKDHLNGLLKMLQTQGPSRWRRALQTVSLVSGTATYTLSPRPDAVKTVYHRDTAGRDLLLQEWPYDDYEKIPVKTSTGRPTVYAVDRQISATTLTLWPVPNASAASGTLRVSYERVMNDVELPADVVDVPQEWLDTIIDVIAARLATSFRLENPSVQKIETRAAAGLAELLGYDRERSIRFSIATE